MIAEIATGQIEDVTTGDGKIAAAVALAAWAHAVGEIALDGPHSTASQPRHAWKTNQNDNMFAKFVRNSAPRLSAATPFHSSNSKWLPMTVLSPPIEVAKTLLSAPIELAGDWGRMLPRSTDQVVERSRARCAGAWPPVTPI